MNTEHDETESEASTGSRPTRRGEVVDSDDSADGRNRAGRAVRALGTRTDLAEVQLSDEHISTVLAQRGLEIENERSRSEHEHEERTESRRLAFVLTLIAIAAVVAVIVFLTLYRQTSLLSYIISGIGGLIAGAFGGYGYANRPR